MGILNDFSLEGKVALVTGGAGTAGRQIVAALAEAGAATIVASRSLETIEAIARSHRDTGLKVSALQFDQAEEASCLSLRDRILERHGQIDILVNNAVARPMRGGYEDEAANFALSTQININGLFILTRAIGDAMAERQRGSIINVGSIHGMIGPDEHIYRSTTMHGWAPDYFFHKGGLINFTRFLASYYGRFNIRCNCVSPGGIANEQPEAFVKQYNERTFLNRMVGDSDLKGIMVLLASDASAYITGVNIPVDGGYTAK